MKVLIWLPWKVPPATCHLPYTTTTTLGYTTSTLIVVLFYGITSSMLYIVVFTSMCELVEAIDQYSGTYVWTYILYMNL
jgi:hypothetical protein